MRTIKAKPTLYNGVEFRSRTEARWARLFDMLNVHYDYEPECYEFGGEYYTPDFYLSGSRGLYLEIKPISEYGDFNEGKVLRFAESAKTCLLVVYGLPDKFEMNYIMGCIEPDGEISYEVFPYNKPKLMKCKQCSSVGFADREANGAPGHWLLNLTPHDITAHRKSRFDFVYSTRLDALCHETARKRFAAKRGQL